jgi:CheY-like chemotaxis protein
VRQLIVLHGGSVTAHSQGIGQGSTLVLLLPKGTEAGESSTNFMNTSFRKNYKVLLIEDNDDAREIMAALLQSYGHEVLQASNGTDGLQMVKDYQPDITMVDIGLPGIDGHEVARRIRADASVSDMPLIALTGYGMEHDRQRAIDAGFNLHLVKPASTSELIKAIEICVSKPVRV